MKRDYQEEKTLSTRILELLRKDQKKLSYETQTSVVFNLTKKMEKMEKQYKRLEKVSDGIYKTSESMRMKMMEFMDLD
jgi:hypothetical protein